METSKRMLKPPIKISILEKHESEVSYCWKALMIFSYVIILISGIASSLAIGSVIKMFGNECILYSTPTRLSVVNKSISIDATDFYWGAMSYCNFCQFCPVASVIFAGIWGVLFVMCGRGGNPDSNLPQPWRIVPPAILFNLVFVVLSCVSVAFTFGGFTSFCDAIIKNDKVVINSCEDLDDYTWKEYPKAQFFYDDVIIAEVGSTITLLAWFLGFMVLTVRCLRHADFHIVARPAESTPISSQDESTVTTTANSSATVSPKSSPSDNDPLIILGSQQASSSSTNPIKQVKKK